MFTKRVLSAAIIGGVLMIGTAVPSFARDRRSERCELKIHKAEENVRKAERRHGERSRQAENKRMKLRHLRDTCR